ncbi:MAG TPA: class I SAM-dependent methyltransferase [Fimbriimonas sp.]|nr:class I SAM-dependent methyltransferase [Fimbriimonas sp.]
MNADEYTKMFQLEDRYWWFVGRRQLALSLLKSALKPSALERPKVLDLGCGTGVVLRELQAWATPYGLDMSPLALRYCSQRGLNRTVIGDGARMPIASNSVNAIIGLDIFEHIENDAAAFKESFRVLKPEGVLVLSVPAFESLWGPHDVALMHFRRYRRPELRSRLTDAGFEVKRIGYSVFFLFPLVVVWRFFEKRKKGPAQASLVQLPKWLNGALVGLQRVETALIGLVDLPIGSSVVAVARKPSA